MTRHVSVLFLLALGLAACDAGFDGSASDNRAPETELAVRSNDLREDLDDRRLISTVDVAWSGTDPDGVVTGFDVRSYQVDASPAPEDGWARTARRDSTIRLVIPLGASTADVVVEVRAVDDQGAVDESPARTVFPIRNSNPTFRIVSAEAPPDTTWPVVSFSFAAADIDGEENIAGVEVALNDTTGGFVRLDPDVTFVSLVADDPAASTTTATLYTGRGFRNADASLPGFRLDDDNVVYFRAVDQAGATSPTLRYPALDEDGVPVTDLFVRRVTSSVLLVNDVRVGDDQQVLDVARAALAANGTGSFDLWDLSETPQSTASPQFSDALPPAADPTLRQTLALWDRIYWVSNTVTNTANGNNLPRAASVMDLFFDRGGRILVQVPVSLPQGTDVGGTANAAIDILPLGDLITFPEGVRALRANGGTPVRPQAEVPGTGRTLPPLQATRLITSALPYAVGPDDVPLYRMSFYENNVPSDTWEGAEVLASIRADRRSALFALPLFAGPNPLFEPADGGSEGVVDALALMLDGLDFPATSGRFARR
ncbi:hypothetical protein [Rubrivirga marina]|uniref:Fibronectin type-III domain-containing protein n=1 Tax=Rubrivirga marina TaxID=1196024 RepID=A0A271J146_9BACT|nr:hypothetical protein [Rubrivirga marina]PAP76675.1 hypothetical protein BSZ37_09590 [Rubrivirga marina]